MKALVTGISGFLGRFISEAIIVDIVSLGRNSDSTIKADISTTVPALPLCDLVIHAAGKAHAIPKTEFEKQEFYNVNVGGTVNLLKGLERSGLPKQFVFISSVSVYGQETGVIINEEFPLLAKDPYGMSKIEAERVVQEWCLKNNVICSVLRLPLLVGENAPGNLGAMEKAISKGYYFNIGGGKAKKSMVLAKDVAQFIPIVAPIGGVYNLTDGYHPNFAELSKAIAILNNRDKIYNLPLPMANLLGMVGDLLGDKAPINTLKIKKIVSELTFDDSKARKLLKWNPEPVLDYFKNYS